MAIRFLRRADGAQLQKVEYRSSNYTRTYWNKCCARVGNCDLPVGQNMAHQPLLPYSLLQFRWDSRKRIPPFTVLNICDHAAKIKYVVSPIKGCDQLCLLPLKMQANRYIAGITAVGETYSQIGEWGCCTFIDYIL